MSDIVDICIVCALPEELEAVREVFHRRSGIKVEPASSRKGGRDYFRGQLFGKDGETNSVHLSCPPRYGGVELALHLPSILAEFEPRIAAMTGLCAGDPEDTNLGDIVVAESAFQYDTGKIILDERDRRVHKPDTKTFHPDQDLLAFAQTFRFWKQSINRMTRPRSLRSQEDWLIYQLIQNPGTAINELPAHELERNAPQWKSIIQRLRRKKKDRLIDDKLRIIDAEAVRACRTLAGTFPFIDPEIRCLVKPIASGNSVRADRPFKDVRRPVRSAIGIDMEGAAFYRTVADFRNIASILVKAVCDFADPDKDDTYHKFAAVESASYLYSLLHGYVTSYKPPRLIQDTTRQAGTRPPVRPELLNVVESTRSMVEQVLPIEDLQLVRIEKFALDSFPWHNLPHRNYTEFIGRETELEALAKLISPTSRFFYATIDGVGGVGKTALALEFAYRELDRYATLSPDERYEAIVWVSAKRTVLTEYGIHQHEPSFNTLADLFREIAIVLKQPGILKKEVEQQRAFIIQALRDQRTLLVLDNLETADDEKVLSFIRTDLPVPTRVIITSRYRVDAIGEIVLTGMTKSDASDLMIVEAHRKDVELSPSEGDQLYEQTGGVPLAIVWSIGLMSLGHEIDRVLRRLRSGRSDISQFCFTQSLERIREYDAYQLLLALAVFEGSVNKKMAGEVAGFEDEGVARDRRNEALTVLLQLSMTSKEEGRFTLLPLTRSFTLDELQQHPETERELRRQWVKSLSKIAEPFNEPRWFYRPRRVLRDEGMHLVTLASWCQQQDRFDILLAILPAVREYYDLEGLWAERIKLSATGLEYAQLLGDKTSEISIKVSLAWILSQQGDHARSQQLIVEAIQSAEEIKNNRWLCEALITHAIVSRRHSDHSQAIGLCNQAMELLPSLADVDKPYVKAWIDYEMGLNARDQADWETAQKYFLEAREVLRIDDEHPTFNLEFAWVLHSNLGFIKQQTGDLETPKRIYSRSIDFFREAGSKGQVVTILTWLAMLEEKRGDKSSASEFAHDAIDLAKRLGMPKAIKSIETVLTRLGN